LFSLGTNQHKGNAGTIGSKMANKIPPHPFDYSGLQFRGVYIE
jgi:hypothetical protein